MKLFGPNWQTTVSQIGGTLFAALTFLSAMSYDQGPLALVVPPKYKPTVTTVAGIATVILWFWNGIRQKDKNVTGGSTQQTLQGNYAQPGTQTLVDITKEASKLSGEIVSTQKPIDPIKP